MAPILGRTQAVGLGKETTPGTPVAPTVFIPHQELSIEDVKDTIEDNSAFGLRYNTLAIDTSQERAEGNLNGIIYDRSFGHIALAAMGSVVTDDHADAIGVKVHTFSVGNTLPTYTIAKKDGNESVRHPYSMLNQLEINVAADSYATYTSSWMTRKGVSTANTVVLSEENRFRPSDVKVYIADDVAGLDAATALDLTSFGLTINNNLISDPTLGTLSPNFYPGEVETGISFDKLYKDTVFHDLVFGTTAKALRIAMIRTDVSIGNGVPTNPSVVFTFEPGFFMQWSRSGGLADLKTESNTYRPIYSFAESKQFTLEVTNTETAY